LNEEDFGIPLGLPGVYLALIAILSYILPLKGVKGDLKALPLFTPCIFWSA
jgi:hypothetical protein